MASIRYDLLDLRLFMNVAEVGNLTRGATNTCLSIGAASMRIKNLEEVLGARLFLRHSQGVTLTPAGEALLLNARRVFQDLERLHGDLQAFSRGLKGQVRIFANTTAITEILPAALGTFLASHPMVDIDLEERLSPEIARAVADGTVDIGILAGDTETEGVELIPYRSDRLALAVPLGHRLSKEASVDFADVVRESFVSLQRGSAIHAFIENVAGSVGLTPHIRIRVSSFESLCRMVESGVGVGLLPESAASRLRSSHSISIVPLNNSWAVRELKICTQRLDSLPMFARNLVDHLVTHAASALKPQTSMSEH
ncbi:LysR substrate-binding domain-containing protein [Aminobacter ciceronei]|uniref:DNA-binding transcriptional LysR family regulator n=1 Tax=Aminobacter ciceronei TaxID=150723 RepID=A0ABR6CH53_9HYPH|nr:LysR substrate-binding domain-containing protein [Aminobacter ciceronei]MBA8909925.1 DNA-binding transcriptional LysR family regulator [Aminobacter ciceronei]MBA9023697.1 DNA-binding transcriptional LysR family regulator [Aminobacter ciceronei]